MAIYTISPKLSCVNLCKIMECFRPKLSDCVRFHEVHCFQKNPLEVPSRRCWSCFKRQSTCQNNHTRDSSLTFDTQTFGALNNSGFTHTRDSGQDSQNGDVSRVRGMQTNTDIIDSVPLLGSRLGLLIILRRFFISTRQPSLQYMKYCMEANTSEKDILLSY